jgi:hypothetical protein
VLRDDPRIAMIHGSFAAMVFALMCVLVQVTSRSWNENTVHDANRSPRRIQTVKPLAVMTAVMILVQYMIGGTLRHLGMALYEHVAMAVLVALLVVVTVVVAVQSGVRLLRRPAGMLNDGLRGRSGFVGPGWFSDRAYGDGNAVVYDVGGARCARVSAPVAGTQTGWIGRTDSCCPRSPGFAARRVEVRDDGRAVMSTVKPWPSKRLPVISS